MRIDGLTTEQVEMLDKLWSMDTSEEVKAFRDTLPLFRRQQIDVLMEMVMQEIREEELKLMDQYPDAEKLIARAKKG